jgi:aspartate-semialdehyde dehydrogenase
MKVAVVGASGLVGSIMLKVLEERNFEVTELMPVASEKSVGKKINFKNKEYKIISIDECLKRKPQIALFSAGGNTSKQEAEKFAAINCVVIDNSSAWRMDTTKKLIVPEVNGHILKKEDKIIANPNCSTIQLVVALNPLHLKYKIKRIVVSTYQAVTGTGVAGVLQLNNERKGLHQEKKVYPHQIDLNCLPHGGDFTENGYTTEEEKLVNETRKIMGDNTIQVSATVVRVPVFGGHSESVNVEFENDFDLDEVISTLKNSPGIVVQDTPEKFEYPMPINAEGKDEVFVGRIRRDFSQPNTLNMWVVSDNLRKGAATNAVQIAELVKKII